LIAVSREKVCPDMSFIFAIPKAYLQNVAIVCSIGLPLAACAGGEKLQPVALPNAPACMNPVAKPDIRAGQDARVALLKTDKALDQANGRLTCSRKWYNGVKKSYSPTQ
jgi:hypothetical protein